MRLTDIPAAPTLDGSETVLGLKAGAAALLPFAQGPTRGLRAALIGDSIIGYNVCASNQGGAGYYPNGAGSTEIDYGQAGFFTAFNQISGHKLFLDPVQNHGVSGDSTAQMAARFDADIAANYTAFDWLFLMGGTNDGPASVAKEATLANLQAMALAALANRKTVVLFTILPRASSAWSGAASADVTAWTHGILWVNAQLRVWARQVAASAPLFLVDAWQDWADPAQTQTAAGSGYALAAGVAADGLHPSGYGAYLIGRRINDAIGAFLPPRATAGMGAIDVFDASQNPFGNALANPVFAAATGGTNSGSSVSGSVPADWTAIQYSGSTVVAADVALSTLSPLAAGYGARQGSAVQFTVDIASGKAGLSGGRDYSGEIDFTSANVAASGFWVIGGVYQATARLKLSGLAGFCGASLGLAFTPDGTPFRRRMDGSPNLIGGTSWGQEDQTLTLMTPPLTVTDPVSSPYGAAALALYFDARTAAATGLVQLSDMQLRRIG